jgi:hypothetical protein
MRYISDQLDKAEDQLSVAERKIKYLEAAVKELREMLEDILRGDANTLNILDALKNTEDLE